MSRDWHVTARNRTRASVAGGEHTIKEPFEQLINTKGLVAGCHSYRLFFIFFIFIQSHSYNTFIRHHSPGSLSMSSSLVAQWEKPPCGAELRIELGPALQQADALPTEPRRTIKSHAAPSEPRRTIRATPHHSEPRRTITEPRRTININTVPIAIRNIYSTYERATLENARDNIIVLSTRGIGTYHVNQLMVP